MSGGQTYICNPGSSFIEPGTEADVCKCRHIRAEHWWGAGNCGDTYKNGNPCKCEYFHAKTESTR